MFTIADVAVVVKVGMEMEGDEETILALVGMTRTTGLYNTIAFRYQRGYAIVFIHLRLKPAIKVSNRIWSWQQMASATNGCPPLAEARMKHSQRRRRVCGN